MIHQPYIGFWVFSRNFSKKGKINRTSHSRPHKCKHLEYALSVVGLLWDVGCLSMYMYIILCGLPSLKVEGGDSPMYKKNLIHLIWLVYHNLARYNSVTEKSQNQMQHIPTQSDCPSPTLVVCHTAS